MNWFATANELTPHIERGDTETAVLRISEILASLPPTPFHQVLTLDFTNSLDAVGAHFDAFLQREMEAGPVGAVYTETNGFDINPDRWYFDVFAYEKYGGEGEPDWLSDWQSSSFPEMTLTDMEALQAVYDTEEEYPQNQEDAMYHCSLLVVAKFQDLIGRSVPHMTRLKVPLLATGHEYDFIAEFRPSI